MVQIEKYQLKEVLERERIDEIARLAMPSVAVVGIGGAGCNIVSWIKMRGIVGGKLLALNTDANHLRISTADKRILIGEKITRGIGCGGYAEKGEKALLENLQEIKTELSGANIVFIVAGLGGGTGTGGSYTLAEALRKTGAMTIGVVTIPFSIERVRRENAKKGIENLLKYCDTVVAIDNSKLVEVAGDMPFRQALGVANELVGSFVKGITETITTASLINLDFADLRTIMEGRGLAAIGFGSATDEDRVEKAAKKALDSQLLDINDMTKSHGVLVHVEGGADMTLSEVTKAGELVTRSLPPETKIVWGARVNDHLGKQVRLYIVLTGIESAFLTQERQRRRRKFGPFRF